MLLGYHQMVVGAGRHLRQVGDGEYLALLTQLLHEPADGLRDRTADARVHFVEYQGSGAPHGAGGHGNGQCDPRELAA